jgi:hypothetical protein
MTNEEAKSQLEDLIQDRKVLFAAVMMKYTKRI